MTDEKDRRQGPDGSAAPADDQGREDMPIKEKAAAVEDPGEGRDREQARFILLAALCNVLDNFGVSDNALHDLTDADFLRPLYKGGLMDELKNYLTRIAEAIDSTGGDEWQQYIEHTMDYYTQTNKGRTFIHGFILLWRSMRRVQIQFEGAGLTTEEMELSAYILYLLGIDPANPNDSGEPLTLEDLRRLRGMKEVKGNPKLLKEIEKSWFIFTHTGEWTGFFATDKKPAADEKIKTRTRKKRKEKQFPEIAPIGSIPNGGPINFLFRVFNTSKGGRIVKSSPRNRHEKITALQKGDALRFIQENKQTGTTAIVEIDQADKYLSKTNKTFIKVLLFTLQKMTAQNFPLEVGFSLQELVDLGMYATTSNASRAVKEFFAQQKLTTISGTVKKGRKTIKEEGGVLFYHYRLENGFVRLSVNENLNMEFIAPYFTIFPRFAYALNNNAFSLVRYIFFLARQNAQTIKGKGTFKISLEAVRENLGLPSIDEVKNRKYRQYIIEPIEKAIEEVEEALLKVPEAKECDFTITPYLVDTSNINQWMQGYLEVGLNGDFAKAFIEITTKAEKNRAQWEKVKAAELARIAARAEVTEAKGQADQSTKKKRAKAQK